MTRLRISADSALGDPRRPRSGAMIVLILFLLVVILAMTVLSVDTAYMQLVRTELRAATDAAAKAGAYALQSSNGDANAARSAAVSMAARHKVGGRTLVLSNTDIILGQSIQQEDGSWKFVADQTPYTAVKVAANMSSNNATGSVNLLFSSAFNSGPFTPARTSTASQLEQDIVLCIDRSHSMCFDESGINWSYPLEIPLDPNPITVPPHGHKSRWAQLKKAENKFTNEMKKASVAPRLALVTWGSKITLLNFEGWLTGRTFPAVNIDAMFTTDYNSIDKVIKNRGNDIMLGGTNMSAGIDQAVSLLTASARPLAKKTIILMTDGQWNAGRDPALSAADAYAAGVTVHTITFLDNVDQTKMKEIAKTTGGQYFHASNGQELEEVFTKLAQSLPVVLTE